MFQLPEDDFGRKIEFCECESYIFHNNLYHWWIHISFLMVMYIEQMFEHVFFWNVIKQHSTF